LLKSLNVLTDISKQKQDLNEKKKEPRMRRGYWYRIVFLVVLAGVVLVGIMASAHAVGPTDYFRAGTLYLQQERLYEAIEAFSLAIGEQASYVEAYNNRALAYYELGEHEKAKDDFLTAVSLDPENPVANSNLGILFFEEGNYRQALKYLEKAARASKSNKSYRLTVLRNLAFVYQKAGMADRAKALIQEAAALEKSIDGGQRSKGQSVQRPFTKESNDHTLVLKLWE